MNQLQTTAHAEGFSLVADAFNARKAFNVDAAVAWLNHHAQNDRSEETLQLFDRDADGNMTSAKKIVATRSELSGYRVAGIFSAFESIRCQLEKCGVTLSIQTRTVEQAK